MIIFASQIHISQMMFNIQYLVQHFVSGANCTEVKKGMIVDFETRKNVCFIVKSVMPLRKIDRQLQLV